jgi:hypothetical protein
LYRWHWHLDAWPRVPKTICRSSQLASLAGITEIAGSLAVMRTIVPVERLIRALAVCGAAAPTAAVRPKGFARWLRTGCAGFHGRCTARRGARRP